MGGKDILAAIREQKVDHEMMLTVQPPPVTPGAKAESKVAAPLRPPTAIGSEHPSRPPRVSQDLQLKMGKRSVVSLRSASLQKLQNARCVFVTEMTFWHFWDLCNNIQLIKSADLLVRGLSNLKVRFSLVSTFLFACKWPDLRLTTISTSLQCRNDATRI